MSEKPKRIQRKRMKGWRMAEGAVYVGRPTRWGNPFAVWNFGHERGVGYFRAFATGEIPKDISVNGLATYRKAESKLYGAGPATLTLAEQARIFLRGKDLACWCPLDKPCHADVLIELANVPLQGDPHQPTQEKP